MLGFFFLATVGKLNSFKSHFYSLLSCKPALLPEDCCSFPLLPPCRRIKLFLSAVSRFILFSQCSSFLGRGVLQIYSFHYLRLKLLMRFMLAAGCWGKAPLYLHSWAARTIWRRHWTWLQTCAHTINDYFICSIWVFLSSFTNHYETFGFFLRAAHPDPG